MARQVEGQGAFEAMVPDGHFLSEAVTSLIKALRRADEVTAIYWAKQIERGGYQKYLWRRLGIFAAEDVGLANLDAVVQIRALWESYQQIFAESNKKEPDGNLIAMAILLLARSEKSREVDDFKNAADHLVRDFKQKPVKPDYVYDLHSQEGRSRWPRRGRLRQWIESASQVENRTGHRDWHLWILKMAAQRGIYSVPWVQAVAEAWDRAGFLLHGANGPKNSQVAWTEVVPEFPGMPAASPELTEAGWLSEAPWTWTCGSCGKPLDRCGKSSKIDGIPPGDPCCEGCDHQPPDLGLHHI